MTPFEWILDEVERETCPDDPWHSRRQLVEEARKVDDLDPDRVDTVVDIAIDQGDLFGWHGLVTLVDEDRLRGVVQDEVEREITRSILVGKANQALQEVSA